jgi:hypothetical protein
MPVRYSIHYCEEIDPFNPSSAKRHEDIHLESELFLTPSEITDQIIKLMKPAIACDVKMTSQTECVEYEQHCFDDSTIFDNGHIYSIRKNSSPKSIWKGRVSVNEQMTQFVKCLEWWESQLAIVAIPSTIKDKVKETYSIVIQFPDVSLQINKPISLTTTISDLATLIKTCVTPDYNFNIVFQGHVIFNWFTKERNDSLCYRLNIIQSSVIIVQEFLLKMTIKFFRFETNATPNQVVCFDTRKCPSEIYSLPLSSQTTFLA